MNHDSLVSTMKASRTGGGDQAAILVSVTETQLERHALATLSLTHYSWQAMSKKSSLEIGW
jgi:hypothetical protein